MFWRAQEHAASAYDVARLKTKGRNARTNFSVDTYDDLFPYLDKISLEDLVLAVRRQSQGFSRFSSLRGIKWVTQHPATGKWEGKKRHGTPTTVCLLHTHTRARAHTHLPSTGPSFLTSSLCSESAVWRRAEGDSPRTV